MASDDNQRSSQDTADPDYPQLSTTSQNQEVNLTLEQEDAKEQAVLKIQKVIRQQFALELRIKEKEIDLIDQRIHQAKMMLDRLRACVLASQYGSVTTKRGITRSSSAPNFPSILNLKRKSLHSSLLTRTKTKDKDTDCNDNVPGALKHKSLVGKQNTSTPSQLPANSIRELQERKNFDSNIFNGASSKPVLRVAMGQEIGKSTRTTFVPMVTTNLSDRNDQGGVTKPELAEFTPQIGHTSSSRFYVKKRIIVGNTSKYIPIEKREGLDRSTHKWMVYVRGPPDDTHIEKFIQKVWFFLHPSYRPNDLVEVSQPPFRLTRRGWGEFPIRVQLHFVDGRNKRVDIIHPIKLDQTYTGLQTLGSETTVDLELDRDTVEPTLQPQDHVDTQPMLPNAFMQTNCNGASLDQASYKKTTAVNGLNHVLKRRLDDVASSICFDSKKGRVESSTPCVSSFSTPISSLPGSRCVSPETVRTKTCTLPEDVQSVLHKEIKGFPLINPNKRVSVDPYAALSLEEFFCWNIGKRRACEWGRALALRQHVQSKHVCNVTTKDIMKWCQYHAYTPCDPPNSTAPKLLCKHCGTEDKHSKTCQGQTLEQTVTCAHATIKDLQQRRSTLPSFPILNGEEDVDDEVDVVGDRKEPVNSGKPSTKPVMTLPLTSDVEWVKVKALEIGVSFESVVWDQVCMPGTEKTLSAACECFMNELVRTTYSIVCEQSSPFGSKVLLPVHVRQAILQKNHFDFLTNCSLGVTTDSTSKS